MPYKDKNQRNANQRARHAQRKEEDPEWVAKRAEQQRATLAKRIREQEGYLEKIRADSRKWAAEFGKEYQRNRLGCISREEYLKNCEEKRRKSAAYMREWSQTDAGKRTRVAAGIKRHHGLTIDEYDAAYDAQQGCCKICGLEKPRYEKDRLAVDHCHISGSFRALLCTKCNCAIGLLGEDPRVLNAAIEYLKSVKGPTA